MSTTTDQAGHLRRQATQAEARLWRVLRNRALNGWKFRRQCPVGGFIADFACLDARLVVEVDGATHGSPGEQARDLTRTEHLARCGFEVLRVQNTDVLRNLEGVRETILAALEQRAFV